VEAAMRILIKLVVESDDARVVNEREIVRIERGAQTAIEQSGLGLTLREAKAALAATQQGIVTTQAEQIVSRARHCTNCATALKVKDSRPIVYRTLYGKIRVHSPRLLACACRLAASRKSFSPLAQVLTDRSHPELLYLTTRWGLNTVIRRQFDAAR
jgi:hypothetical protein